MNQGSSAMSNPASQEDFNFIQAIVTKYEQVKHDAGKSTFLENGNSTAEAIYRCHTQVFALDLHSMLHAFDATLVSDVERITNFMATYKVGNCIIENPFEPMYTDITHESYRPFDERQCKCPNCIAERITAMSLKLDEVGEYMQALTAKQVLIKLADGNDPCALQYFNKLTPASKKQLQRTVFFVNKFMRLNCDDEATRDELVEVAA
jgi:hypothetical protein